ncbi:hypothetical protein BZL29_0281 [Mycobacterium kansasii]|uniref:Uncharacterized protein n=1 Tax=Mycobacterium kansasii TaxID=1768 RepID=A0A1V3XY76_MYCKA|nr:hypothetical protein BZL29_0281 [Mycobacterium kansasii]
MRARRQVFLGAITRLTVVTPGMTSGLRMTECSQSMSAIGSPTVHGERPSGTRSPVLGAGLDGNGMRWRWAASR